MSRRLTEALREEGAQATLLTADAWPRLKSVPFVAERLRILAGLHGDTANIWKIDTGSFGLPLWRHPVVREADAVILNWFNQGMLSLDGIRKIASMGKKIVWTMHDMWPMTGICHHSLECRRFNGECGRCPLLPGCREDDLSHRIWKKKRRLYDDVPVTFVAVSRWLAGQARSSGLLRNRRLAVIPNPFRLVDREVEQSERPLRILFAAATLDNWIKGLDIFREAVGVVAGRHPGIARTGGLEVWLMGSVKDERSLEGFAVPVRYLGKVEGDDRLADVYSVCDVVVNCSLFENLPGTLIEGQAYGAVPVAFSRGGQDDIIDHLHTGYLAPWSDSREARAKAIASGIEWALERREQLIPLMRKSVEARFGYETVARRYLDLLRR